MNYEARKAVENQSKDRAAEVVALGVARGLWVDWTPARDPEEARHTPREIHRLETPEGIRFYLSGGSWNAEHKVAIAMDTLYGPHQLKVSTRDVMRYEETAPEAACSHTRDAAAILKDFERRMVKNPEVARLHSLMRDRLDTSIRQHAELRAHMATAEALGFDFRNVSEDQTYRADGYGHKLRKVEVYTSGHVTAEVTIPIDKLAALLALLPKD